MMTIDEMQIVLNELAEELPEVFFKELNGGILLLPEAKPSEFSRNGDLFNLGEYSRGSGMGKYITIYYGSFARLFPHISDEAMKKKLRDTLRHEFRHHMETLAGERGLEFEDARFINDYLDKKTLVQGRKKSILHRIKGNK